MQLYYGQSGVHNLLYNGTTLHHKYKIVVLANYYVNTVA